MTTGIQGVTPAPFSTVTDMSGTAGQAPISALRAKAMGTLLIAQFSPPRGGVAGWGTGS